MFWYDIFAHKWGGGGGGGGGGGYEKEVLPQEIGGGRVAV